MADQLPGLSIAVIRENPSAVKRSLEARGLPSSLLETVLTADALHREGTQALEEANRKLNELSKLMKDPKQERFEELKREAKEVSALQKELKLRKAQLRKEVSRGAPEDPKSGS